MYIKAFSRILIGYGPQNDITEKSESVRCTVNIIKDSLTLLAVWNIQSFFHLFFLSIVSVGQRKQEINFLCQAIYKSMNGTIFHPYFLQGVIYIVLLLSVCRLSVLTED
jgi:hypothetical protein